MKKRPRLAGTDKQHGISARAAQSRAVAALDAAQHHIWRGKPTPKSCKIAAQRLLLAAEELGKASADSRWYRQRMSAKVRDEGHRPDEAVIRDTKSGLLSLAGDFNRKCLAK